MEELTYFTSKPFAGRFSEAEKRISASLKEEGFGVLTEIDVKTTLKRKLNVSYPKYKILGACNPPFAYQALQAEAEIGALLPCNVLVYEKGKQVRLGFMRPTVMLDLTSSSQIKKIATDVEQKLTRALHQATAKE